LQAFDLEGEVARLRGEGAWREGKRNAITLRKGGGMNLLLVAMRDGDRLEEHSAPGPIAVFVREGRIRFRTSEETVEAGSEKVLACAAGVRHSVEALGDAVFVVAVATGAAGAVAGSEALIIGATV
jgi:quercetin dioxygenase-like cupin family protein